MTKAAEKETQAPPQKKLTLADLMKLKTRGMLNREPIEIPEWGGVIYLQELTGAQQEKIYLSNKAKEKAQEDLSLVDSVKVLFIALVDEDGDQLFKTEEQCQEFIMALPGRLITLLTTKAGELNEDKQTEKN